MGVHLESTRDTDERVVAGPTSGALALGDEVTWEARHFARRWRLTVRITVHERPRMFRDEMIRGPFRRMRHDHWFDAVDGRTRMRDDFEFAAIPVLDELVLAPHLRRLLSKRNELIRDLAEREAEAPLSAPAKNPRV